MKRRLNLLVLSVLPEVPQYWVRNFKKIFLVLNFRGKNPVILIIVSDWYSLLC